MEKYILNEKLSVILKRISELSTIPQCFLYVQESRIPKPTSHGLKAVICDIGSTKTNVHQVRTTCSILHKMANSRISDLELNHWWHYSERWQQPGYAVLMWLIIWKSWPTYNIHCCRKGEYMYVGTPIILFFPRSYFPDSREFDGHILLHCPWKECFMLLDKLFLLPFV